MFLALFAQPKPILAMLHLKGTTRADILARVLCETDQCDVSLPNPLVWHRHCSPYAAYGRDSAPPLATSLFLFDFLIDSDYHLLISLKVNTN
jgi:hypothetical protein